MPQVTLDKELLKSKVFDYFNVDELRSEFGHAGETEWNPFKLDDAGNPIGFDVTFKSISTVPLGFVHTLTIILERITTDLGDIASGSGETKKEALLDLLDDIVKAPFWAEPFDRMLFKIILDHGVSLVVKGLNSLFGNDWIKKIPSPKLMKPTVA